MKSYVILLTLLIAISGTAIAQKKKKKETEDAAKELNEAMDKIFNTKVDMKIDTTIFESHEGNMYMSEQHQAFIMTMVAPQSIEKAEEKFNEPTEKEGLTILDKKKFEHDGRTFFYQSGQMDKDGQKAMIYIYQIEASPESTILISATVMGEEKEEIRKVIEQGALSAKLAEE